MPVLSAVAISLGLAGSTFIAASSWKDVRKKPDKNNIRITGSARKRIVSDLIQWSSSVEAEGAGRKAADANMGINDTSSRDKDIITIVYAEFEVE